MILLTVFIASIVLPDFYKTSFKRNVKYVSLNYSEVTKQFVIWGLKDGVSVRYVWGMNILVRNMNGWYLSPVCRNY